MNAFFGLISLLLATLAGGERHDTLLPLGEESVLRLEGGSTIRDWSCTTSSLEAWTRKGSSAEAGELLVPIVTLECGDGRMEADLRKALREPEHPSISFILTRWDLTPEQDGFRGVAGGSLALAGVTRDVQVAVHGEIDDSGDLRVLGSTDLLMTDFGIQPPSAFFGLIKARDRVVVAIDLRVDAAAVREIRSTL